MTKTRIPISKSVERELLFRNQSVCCICQKSGVQIHHIDDDPSNNKLSNLCVLCVEHHAHASSVGTMTKGLDAALLRRYKSEWESLVWRRREAGVAKSRSTVGRSDKQLLRFEIRKTGFSLPGTRSKAAFIQGLDYIYNWCVVEGNHSDAVEVLSKIHWLMDEWQVQITASRLYEFFWHFVGPDRVPMSRHEQESLIAAIELLGDLGYQAAVLTYRPEVTEEVISSLRAFHEIGGWYKRPVLNRAVHKALRTIKKEIESWLKDRSNKAAAKGKLAKALARVEKAQLQLK